ncbi:MAG TPA: hypothetical protein DCR23_01455 [Ruminococcaceae bacterium]|nr:hypothetical protein [Oscillospiraceae bacterium]
MTPLEEACAISLKRWVDSLPDDIEPYQFSKKHKRRMKVLFNKMRGGRYHSITTRATVLLVAAILIFAMAVTAMAIPYTREFIIEKFFDHSTYTVVGGEYSEIGDIEIGYIPEGFEIYEVFNGKATKIISYKSKSNDMWFDIKFSLANQDSYIDTEKYSFQEIKTAKRQYTYYHNDIYNGIIWNNGNMVFNIYGNTNTQLDEYLAIADSINYN